MEGIFGIIAKGLEWPRLRYKKRAGTFSKLGFPADIFIGSLAAIIFYALNPPSEAIKLVASTLTAGLSSSAILKGYKVASERARLVEGYKGITHMAMKGDMKTSEIQKRMKELEEIEQQMEER